MEEAAHRGWFASVPASELAVVEAAVAALDEGVMVHDGDGTVVALNRAALGLSDRPADALFGARAGAFPVPCRLEDGTPVDATNSPVLEVLRTASSQRDRRLLVEATDGSTRRVRASFHPLVRAGETRPYGVVTSFRDVSGPEELQRFSTQLRVLLEDPETIAYARSARGRMLLLSTRLAPDDVPEEWAERDRAALREHRLTLTEEELAGERFLMIRFPLLDEGGEAYALAAIAADITARARTAEQLAHDALHDPLTGLANRRLLRQHLDLAIARARRNKTTIAVLFLDVDGLKQINDRHGHGVGDEVLSQLAERLRATVRETDVLARAGDDDPLIARHGGDEFLLVLADVPDPDVALEAVTARLRGRIAEPFPVRGTALGVRASIGASVYPRDGADADALIRHADEQMYRAKRG